MFQRIGAAIAGVVFWVGAAWAGCVGQNLFDAMPGADQARLEAMAAAHPFHEGLLWTATRDDQQITLVGTLHYADPRFAPMLDALAPALDGATALLVEAGPEEEAQLRVDMAKLMFSEGATLPERLPEAEWQALGAAMEARGFPRFMASKMQPWFVSLMLAIPLCELAEMQAGQQGLDKQLIDVAHTQDLPLLALEPYDTIFGIFADMTPAEELLALRLALGQAAEAEDMAITMTDLYFAGRTSLIWELALERSRATAPPELPPAELEAQIAESEKLMVTDRNTRWIPVIEGAAANGPIVVAAGALHMPGEHGVLALLQARGWRIASYQPANDAAVQ
ncbi:TraB/GumN family protein [Thioclava sp. A2]|uniref:TraB/GumN family protein n=1 Tax=Thioclava sp. FCG-A2 TaxID=3080562 RepID=UPI002952B747|nr:TraB/GumN family protein [Thioclava sp. A2]MDV7271273.1 TraB/GumN family protein [Thioclava sp. A2]